MWFRTVPCSDTQRARPEQRSALRRPSASAGFTLIEVLVAIAVLAVVLAAIGAVVGTTVKSIRTVDRRLPLLETAQNLLAGLPDRAGLQLGTQSGVSSGLRWRIDVAPLGALPSPVAPLPSLSLNPATPGAQPTPETKLAPRWMPVVITVRVQSSEGPPFRLDTVRLIPRPIS